MKGEFFATLHDMTLENVSWEIPVQDMIRLQKGISEESLLFHYLPSEAEMASRNGPHHVADRPGLLLADTYLVPAMG